MSSFKSIKSVEEGKPESNEAVLNANTLLRLFQEQNEKIANGTINEPGSHFIHLDTLGIINGCIDYKISQLANLDMAYNNVCNHSYPN